MFNEDFKLLNIDKQDQRYEKVWLAAMYPKEFQRLMRFENCELISVPSICDEIAEKLNEDASLLVIQVASKPIHPFLVASQFFIGLVYVHERQVKFLYDSVCHYTVPARFLIENQNIVSRTESADEVGPGTPMRLNSTKGLKRKSSAKMQRSSKRKISLTLDTSDDEDIEGQNLKMLDLLQSSFVAKNADISIHEPEPLPVNYSNDRNHCYDQHFNEDFSVSARNDFVNACNALLEDEMMSMTLNEPLDIAEAVVAPADMCESTRLNDTVCAGAENKVTVSTDAVESELGVPVDAVELELGLPADAVELELGVPADAVELELGVTAQVVEPELGLDNCLLHSTDDDSMNILAPAISNASLRKRKRPGHNQPLKDISLTVNVKENLRTASTTQRHLFAREDSVSTVACLRNLTSKIFVKPNHTVYSESMARQFESKAMSDKLLQAFERMTLTKTEKTNRDMVQEFCSDLLANNQQLIPNVEGSVTVEPSSGDQPNEVLLPDIELSVGGDGQPFNEQILVPNTVEPSIYEIPALFTITEPSICNDMPIELNPSIRQLLVNNETTVESPTRYETDSQKQFASSSRQNKLDWGKEGVLRKLMSLWNSGIYPIGMKEIMHLNNKRISGATAFFSLMELNSARIGLITITKCPDSNVIFNVSKSPKLIELQEML